MDTRAKIAAGLERAFAEKGFAETPVDVLRTAADVSLRTLYKYHPSREAMVVAALDHRNDRYLVHLLSDLPEDRAASFDVVFDRQAAWMAAGSQRGCLFLQALAAYPDDAKIRAAVARHKSEVANGLATATGLPAAILTVLHEGVTNAWPTLGQASADQAKALARAFAAT